MSATAPESTIPTIGETLDESQAEREQDSQLDDIDIQVEDRVWDFKGTIPIQRQPGAAIEMREILLTYRQRPLSYTAMLQFTGFLGEKIVEIMHGDEGVSLDRLFSGISGGMSIQDARQLLTSEDFTGMDAFVRALAKIALYSPDFIEDCQCIWLRVPLSERDIVKQLWAQSPADGGLSMDDGEEMLNLFISQNYQELEDFFVVRLRRVGERLRRLRSRKANGADALPR